MAKATKKSKITNEARAREQVVEDLFYDFNSNRAQVYWVNFTRGIFFGFGVFLGGTVIVALVIWLLGWCVRIPFIGDYIREIINVIKR